MPTDAFLSYTRLDNEFFGGAITSLRTFLELGVKVVTGHRDFNIFQDVDAIEFGERWEKRLDQELANTRFLIPIVTPLFFQSEACRSELEKFVVHVKALGRDDLILPIYFVTAPVLEKPELLRDDVLAREISCRQRYDWRSKADLPVNDPQIRSAVRDLSEKIAAAVARSAPALMSDTMRSAEPEVHEDTNPIVPHDETAKESAFKTAAETVKREKPREANQRGQRTILWVDDRPGNNVFERRAMQSYNITFELAKSTGEALAKIAKYNFDAIISDMGRPPDPQAGYTLLDALRRSGNLTPFLIYAGSDSPEHRRLALSKGAQGSTNRSDALIANVLASLENSCRQED